MLLELVQRVVIHYPGLWREEKIEHLRRYTRIAIAELKLEAVKQVDMYPEAISASEFAIMEIERIIASLGIQGLIIVVDIGHTSTDISSVYITLAVGCGGRHIVHQDR